MLALDSDRWAELTTFFGAPADLPNLLRAWMAAVGSDQKEDLIYRRDLLHSYLHQVTITNSAFAVVPWIVHVCEQRQTRFLAEYLMDVAFVEANRLEHGLHYHRKRTARFPDWLMDDYHPAIAKARDMVDDAVASATDEEAKTGLVAMSPALFGDADQAWKNYRHGKSWRLAVVRKAPCHAPAPFPVHYPIPDGRDCAFISLYLLYCDSIMELLPPSL